ncbi:hypothetical protein ACJX0J_039973, partial [Zea mays]
FGFPKIFWINGVPFGRRGASLWIVISFALIFVGIHEFVFNTMEAKYTAVLNPQVGTHNSHKFYHYANFYLVNIRRGINLAYTKNNEFWLVVYVGNNWHEGQHASSKVDGIITQGASKYKSIVSSSLCLFDTR